MNFPVYIIKYKGLNEKNIKSDFKEFLNDKNVIIKICSSDIK